MAQSRSDKAAMASDATAEPVQVIGRIRPEPPAGAGAGASVTAGEGVLVRKDASTVILLPPHEKEALSSKHQKQAPRAFKLDHAYGSESTQEEVYAVAKPLIMSATQGYNATVFAYGHTSSGKTHTMYGSAEDPGIIPRGISDIFTIINATAEEHSESMFLVRMSFVELYNNNFRNLLEHSAAASPAHDPHQSSPWSPDPTAKGAKSGKIEIRETKTTGVILTGPNLRFPVTSAAEVYRLVAAGNRSRAVGATNCNEHSSRSHSILTFYIESRTGGCGNTGGAGSATATGGAGGASAEVRMGKLHLVDLAGSERISLSGAEGDTLVETQNINLSLATLGNVLSALSRNATARTPSASIDGPALVPVPYRNSKLTHLLKDSLGGNSKTLMVTTLRTTPHFYRQSLVSLMYATRAKHIRNCTAVNMDTHGDSSIHQVSADMHNLKQRLQERTVEFERLRDLAAGGQQENEQLRKQLEGLGQANEREKKEMEAKLAGVIHNQAGQMASQRRLASTLQNEVETYQEKCAKQAAEIQKQGAEIHNLRNQVDFLEKTRSGAGATQAEVAEMQSVLEAWQAQATGAQRELLLVSEKLKAVTDARGRDKTRMQGLEADLSRLRQDREALEAAGTRAASSQAAAAEETQRLRAALLEKETECASMLTHRNELEAGLQAARDSVIRAEVNARDQTRALGAQVESLQADVKGMAEEKSALAEAKARAESEARSVATSATEVAEAVGRREAEHKHQLAELAMHHARVIEQHQTEVATAKAASEQLRAEVETIPQLRAVHDKEAATLKAEYTDLQSKHDKLAEQLGRFQSSVVAMQEETTAVVQESNRSSEKWKAEAERLESELAVEKERRAQAEASGVEGLERSKVQLAELRRACDGKTREARVLEETNRTLESKARLLEETGCALEETRSVMEEKGRQLRRELEVAAAASEELREQVQLLESTHEETLLGHGETLARFQGESEAAQEALRQELRDLAVAKQDEEQQYKDRATLLEHRCRETAAARAAVQADLDAGREASQALMAELDEERLRSEEASSERTRLTVLSDGLAKEVEQLQARLGASTETVEKLEGDVREQAGRCDAREQELVACREKLADAERCLQAELKQALEQAEHASVHHEAQLRDAVQEERERGEAAVAEKQTENDAEHKAQVAAMIEISDQEKQALRKDLDERQEALDEAASKLAAAASDAIVHEARVAELQRAVDVAGEDSALHRAREAEVAEELLRTREQIVQVESAHEQASRALEQQRRQAEDGAQSFKRKCEASAAEVDSLQAALAERDEGLRIRGEEIDALRAEAARLDAQLVALRASEEASVQALVLAEEGAAGLRDALHATEAEASESSARSASELSASASQLAKAERSLGLLRDTNASLEADAIALTERLSTAAIAIEQATDQAKSTEAELERLRGDVASQEAAAAAAREEVGAVQEAHRATQQQHEETEAAVSASRRRCDSLAADTASLRHQVEAAELAAAGTELELNRTSVALDEARRALEGLRESSAEKDAAVESLGQAVATREIALKSAEASCFGLAFKVLMLESRRARAAEAAVDANAAAARAAAEHEALRVSDHGELRRVRAELVESQGEAASLNDRVSELETAASTAVQNAVSLAEQVQSAEQARDAVRSAVEASELSLRAQVAALEVRLEEQREKDEHKDRSMEKSREQFKELVAEQEQAAETALQAKQAEVNRWSEQAETARESVTELEVAKAQLIRDLEAVRAQDTTSRLRIDKLAAELEATRQDADAKHMSTVQLASELKEHRRDAEAQQVLRDKSGAWLGMTILKLNARCEHARDAELALAEQLERRQQETEARTHALLADMEAATKERDQAVALHQKLETQYASLDEEMGAAREARRTLSAELQRLKSDLDGQSETLLKDSEARIAVLANANAALEETRQQDLRKIASLEQNHAAAQEALAKIKAVHIESETRVATLNRDLEERHEAKSKLYLELERTQDALAREEAHVAIANRKVATLANEIRDLRNKLRNHEEDKSGAENRVQDLTAELAEAAKTRNSLVAELDEAFAARNVAVHLNRQAEVRSERREEEYAAEREELSHRLALAEDRVGELDEVVAQREEAATRHQKRLGFVLLATHVSQHQKATAVADLAVAAARADAAEQQYQAELERATAEATSLAASMSVATAQHASDRDALRLAERALSELREASAADRKSLEAARQDAASAQQQLTATDADGTKLLHRIEVLQAEAEQQLAASETYAGTLAAAEAAEKAARVELEATVAERDAHATREDDLLSKLTLCETELKELRTSHTAQAGELGEQLEASRSAERVALQELQVARAEGESSQRATASLVARCEELEGQHRASEALLEREREQRCMADKQAADAEDTRQAALEEKEARRAGQLAILQSQLEDAQQQHRHCLDELAKRNESTDEQLSSQASEIVRLESEVRAHALQLAQSAAHKAQLTATSEALADELRMAREQVKALRRNEDGQAAVLRTQLDSATGAHATELASVRAQLQESEQASAGLQVQLKDLGVALTEAREDAQAQARGKSFAGDQANAAQKELEWWKSEAAAAGDRLQMADQQHLAEKRRLAAAARSEAEVARRELAAAVEAKRAAERGQRELEARLVELQHDGQHAGGHRQRHVDLMAPAAGPVADQPKGGAKQREEERVRTLDYVVPGASRDQGPGAARRLFGQPTADGPGATPSVHQLAQTIASHVGSWRQRSLHSSWKQWRSMASATNASHNSSRSGDAPKAPRAAVPLGVHNSNTNADDPSEVDQLRRQLQREKKNRKKLLAQAANRWIAPPDTDPSELCENIMNAAIEGDAKELLKVLRGAGIDSIQAAAASDASGSGSGNSPLSSMLPLHRAVSGFHFHGNQRLLLKTLGVLIEHGADVGAVDHCGNSVLHKAIQVCTSAAIIPVVRFLLQNGVEVNAQNGPNCDLDTPVVTEIHRLRSKSADVIEMLCSYGADVNRRGQGRDSPLSLILRCAQGREVVVAGNEHPFQHSSSHSGRNFWVPVAHLLVTRGATWEPEVRDHAGRSQLMMMFSGPAPPSKDWGTLLGLVHDALAAGVDPSATDKDGATALSLVEIRDHIGDMLMPQIWQILTDHIADPTQEQKHNRSRLHHAQSAVGRISAVR